MSKALKINKNWFQDQLDRAGLSQRRLAELWGLDPSSITNTLNGNRRLRLDEAVDFAGLVGQPLETVLENAGIHTGQTTGRQSMLKIQGWVDASHNIHMTPPKGPRRVPAAGLDTKGLCVIRFVTPAEPFDGTLVYYRDPETCRVVECVGRLAVVLTMDGRWLLRLVRRGYSPGSFILVTPDGRHEDEDVQLQKAGPVIWQRFN